MKLTYGKTEKLKSKKSIELLFNEGDSVASFPLRLIYVKNSIEDDSSKIGVSVPKKKVPNAVDRNRIKRLMRESYRLNKILFNEFTNHGMMGMFLFVDKNEWSLDQLNIKMEKLAVKLNAKLDNEKISMSNTK